MIRKLIVFTFFIFILNNSCQTSNINNGPGDTPQSVLIIIDKGVVELYIKSNKNDNELKDPDIYDFINALLYVADNIFIEKKIKLSTGERYSYYLETNERVVFVFKPVINKEIVEQSEIIIKNKGVEKKYKINNNIGFFTSYSY